MYMCILHMFIWGEPERTNGIALHTRVNVCMYVCMYVCIYVYICMLAYYKLHVNEYIQIFHEV